MCYHLRRLTLHVQQSYRGPILNRQWRAAGLHWERHNPFSSSTCFMQDFRRWNAVHTLPWPAYSPSCTPSSIRDGPHWLPDTVTWPTSINHGAFIPGNPGGLGWHLTGKNYSSEPIHATEMPSSAWGTRFVTTIIDLAALNGLLHRAKCHNKLLFSKWWFMTDCWFNPYQTISSDSFHKY